jgi:hypothetical protein
MVSLLWEENIKKKRAYKQIPTHCIHFVVRKHSKKKTKKFKNKRKPKRPKKDKTWQKNLVQCPKIVYYY